MKKVTLLFTPGLDSYLTDYCLQEKNEFVKNIIKDEYEYVRMYFHLHSRYTWNEMKYFNNTYESRVIIDRSLNIKDIEKKDAHVPNRNLLLVSMAQSKTDADIVLISGVKDDRVSDNSKKFFDKVSEILSISAQKKVVVTSLFWEKEKCEIVELYWKANNSSEEAAFHLLEKTFSCFSDTKYNSSILPIYKKRPRKGDYVVNKGVQVLGCLDCAACFRRLCAFTKIGLFVPYENLKLANSYRDRVDKKIHPHRYDTVQKYLDFLNDKKIKE